MTVCCMLDYVMFDISEVTCMAGWIGGGYIYIYIYMHIRMYICVCVYIYINKIHAIQGTQLTFLPLLI
jgi:hypothetical protein